MARRPTKALHEGKKESRMMRYLILGFLRDGRARHGYAVMKEYRQKSGRAVSVGNVYRELQRLREGGLVRAGDNPPGADRRRIPYEITTAGAGAFDAWLLRRGGGVTVEIPDDEFSLRAFFGWEAEGEAGHRVLNDWSEELRGCARLLGRARDHVSAAATSESASRQSMWLDRRLRHLAIDLQFVEDLRAARNAAAMNGAERTAPTSRRRRLDARRGAVRRREAREGRRSPRA